MGFFSRLLVPRKVRRVAHPVRSVKRAVTPRTVRRIQYGMHPVSNAGYQLQRSLTTKGRPRVQVYRHGTCTVQHRSPYTAMKCQRTW